MSRDCKVGDLAPDPKNPRRISPERLAALSRSLREFGDLGGVVFNRRTGRLVGGHQRVRALDPTWRVVKASVKDVTGTVARGRVHTPWGELDYREVDWPEARERAANLAANRHGGEFDPDLLAPILSDLRAAGAELELSGFAAAEVDALLGPAGGGALAGTDEVPEPPRRAMTRPGDLWNMGGHRLLCGDSAKKADVQKLMENRRAGLMWTDPPYGVSYVGKTKAAKTIRNDDADGLVTLLTSAFACADGILQDGAAIYIAHPARALSVVFGNCFVNQKWRLHQTLVWVKDSMVLGHSDYHYRHEPILFGYKKSSGRCGRGGDGWYGRNDETSVFEVPRPKVSEAHPTMKPVVLVEQMIRNSSPHGGFIYDPFVGSGTTLIASEKTGRLCFAIELDPYYCDVVVERWQNFTGKKAERRSS